MRRVRLAILGLALLAAGAVVADEPEKEKKHEVLSEGWVIPPGQEQRFAEDERACLGPAMGRSARRPDRRRWETCMEGRGWRRK